MDRIIVDGIEFYAYGGVSPEEQTIGQRYRARVELSLDLSAAAREDDLELSVNYAEVAATVVAEARARPFRLIESLAARVLDRLCERFQFDTATVRIQKLLPPIDGVVSSAAVEMSRSRPPGDGG